MNYKAQKLEKNFISAVVYVHDAQALLPAFLGCITGFMRDNFEKYELIFVNDASSDGSVGIIKEFFRQESRGGMATVLNMGFYQGRELAMSAGMDLAIGDFLFEFDSVELSYPEQMLKDVYEQCLRGYDIVSACPREQGRMHSKFFYSIFNKYSGTHGRLRTEAFRILSRRAVNRVCAMGQGLPYRKAAYAGCGLPSYALFYTMEGGFQALGGMERRMQWDVAMDALMLYTDAAYKFALGFSCLMIAFSVLVCIYIAMVFFAGKPVPGYVSTVATVAFGFFGVYVFMAILIKYASLILKVVFTGQKYITESVEKI